MTENRWGGTSAHFDKDDAPTALQGSEDEFRRPGRIAFFLI